MDDHQRPLRRLLALLVSALLWFSAPAEAQPEVPELSTESRWEAQVSDNAEALLTGDVTALEATATALFWLGRYDEAELLLRRQLEDRDEPSIRRQLGQVLLRRGQAAEAITILDPAVEGAAPDLFARYWRAVAFSRTGRVSRAELEWQDFIRAYNRGATSSGEELMYVAMACRDLGLYSDANDAFRQALEADPENVEIRWRWSELFLEKYRPDEAQTLLDEALQQNPDHPMALVLRARVALDMTYDLAATEQLLRRALAVSPEFPEALELLAEVRLDKQDYAGALELLERVDAVVPNRLEALDLRGAVYWLADNAEGFAETEARVLRIAPTHARFYWVAGEFGVRNFRYVESLELFRQALDLNANFWPAYVSLGIGYSRVGDDTRAVSFLRRAFEHDPFNERAYNMVELFERVLPEYRAIPDEQIDGLSYRFPQREAAVLERYVPPVLRTAWNEYVRRYGLTPELPVSIEVLADQPTFGIRSIGLPYASQHGICFGRLVTSRSPADGDFNWRLVLEHELSHVFSLNASRYRVPRWFTEGLAEYDTILTDNHWRREEEIAIAETLRGNRYIGVLELNDAFIDSNMNRILAAYFQASLLVEYIGETWGYDALVAMLHGWAESKSTTTVIEESLSVSVAELDARFEQHLREMVAGLLGTWQPELARFDDVEALRVAAGATGQSATAHAELAAALLNAGAVEEAEVAIADALRLDAREPIANYLAAAFAAANGDYERAARHFSVLVEAGYDGPEPRIGLAEWSLQRGDLPAALDHVDALQAMYPRSVEAARLRYEIATRQGNTAGALEALHSWALADQHNVEPALDLSERLFAAGDAEGAFMFAQRAVDVAPFVRRVHTALGRAAVAVENWDIARRELELELAAGPEDRRTTLEGLERTYSALGEAELLERVQRELSTLRRGPGR